MKAKIIKIGNSRGVRIPKPLLEETGLTGEVELTAHKDQILIGPVRNARESWDAAFAAMSLKGDDGLIDGDVDTAAEWDSKEWQW